MRQGVGGEEKVSTEDTHLEQDQIAYEGEPVQSTHPASTDIRAGDGAARSAAAAKTGERADGMPSG